MIKLNNRGFAVSTILYGVLSLTILILMLIFGVMKSTKDLNSGLVESLTDSMNKCAILESKLESCYLSGRDCASIVNEYNQCLDGGQTPEVPINGTKLREKILSDNTTILDGANINFNSIYIDSGFYSIKVENADTYFFRGSVDNNYVKFGKDYSGNDLIWKIVRINEDESIRLILNRSIWYYAGNFSFSDITFSYAGASENAYVGYMHGLTEVTNDDHRCVKYDAENKVAVDSTSSYTRKEICEENGGIWTLSGYEATHVNLVNSRIKTAIDSWYEENLIDYHNYLADAGFCNDRSLASGTGYGNNLTNYGAYERLFNGAPSPTFKCPQTNDLFTLKGNENGNAALTYPIGLLTADEIMYAGARINIYIHNYLPRVGDFWTLTPYGINYSDSKMIFLTNEYGETNNDGLKYEGYESKRIVPVINLKQDVILTNDLPDGCTEQVGTASCPYIVDTSV